MKIQKFKTGCLWEGGGFEIHYDSRIQVEDICAHCLDREVTNWTNAVGCARQTTTHRVPRVIVALNEGGHNSTGVCLDCVLDAIKTPPV